MLDVPTLMMTECVSASAFPWAMPLVWLHPYRTQALVIEVLAVEQTDRAAPLDTLLITAVVTGVSECFGQSMLRPTGRNGYAYGHLFIHARYGERFINSRLACW